MKKSVISNWFNGCIGVLVPLAVSAFPQGEKEGQGQIIVTVLPKHDGDPAPAVTAQDMTVKVNGKDSKVTNLQALKGAKDPVELVVLIDGSAAQVAWDASSTTSHSS